MLVAAIFGIAGAAHAQGIVLAKPSFLEAAVFFLEGKEPDPAQIISNSEINLPLTHYRQDKDQPCIVFAFSTAPPYGAISYNFNLFPGPRSAHMYQDGVAQFHIVASHRSVEDTHPTTFARCTRRRAYVDGTLRYVDGSTMCQTDWTLTLPHGERALRALQYIRDNFCEGLPQPPARPLIINPY